MPHPLKIEGASAEIGGIGSGTKAHSHGKNSAPISKQQITEIIQQINQNVGANLLPKPANSSNQSPNQSEHTSQTEGQQLPPNIEPTVLKENGNGNGNGHGRGNGNGHGRGGEINPKPQNIENQPPNLIVQTQSNNNDLVQNQSKPVVQNTAQNQPLNNQGQLQNSPLNNLQLPNNLENRQIFPNQNNTGNPHNPHFSNNQPNNPLNIVVKQVFQQNDIFLNQNDVRKLVNTQNVQTQNSLPPELKSLLQNINERTLTFLENSNKFNGQAANQIATEISRQFREQIQGIKNNLLQNADLNAKHFNQTNIKERMHIAIELVSNHLSSDDAQNFHKLSSQETLNGFLLSRGLIAAKENSADIRNLVFLKPLILPNEITLTALRDVGQFVRILILNAGAAKNTAGLDLSVQKFVRLLIANNELGVLLATVNLAREVNSQGILVNRAIALVKIYELINRLILAGEKAMTEAGAKTQNKNNQQFIEQKLSFTKLENLPIEKDEKINLNSKTQTNGAETLLRQFLEFNPNSAFDNSVAAFFNSDDSRQARQDFSTIYHQDIEQWLESGNHRFVKDYDFDKPIGIVVERNNDGFFNANKIRIVLVRDGSVQGWHILKSILVK